VEVGNFAITNVRTLDGREAAIREDQVLLVGEDGRIADVGRRDTVSVPDGWTQIDGSGTTLVPGLIDCHVHLAHRQEPLHDQVQRSSTDRVVMALEMGRELAKGGITTVRDAGGTPAGVKRAFASGTFVGPRTQVSVNFLSQTGGHGDGFTASGIDLKGELPPDLPSGIADGVDAVRRAARLQIRAGADWIKVMATGGVLSPSDSPGASQFTVEELRAAVEEAHAAGIRGVLAHAAETRGIKNAILAGVASIEHGDLIDEEGLAMMLDRDVPLVPTLLCSFELLSEERIERGDIPPWAVEKMKYSFERQLDNFRRAAELGVRIAMGSDSFWTMYPPAELSLMASHGLGAFSAFRAATIEAARLLGLSDEVGTLETGKAADVLLVDGDPLAEPDLWRDPKRIVLSVLGGVVVADRRSDLARG
jgi:imidazolonepropionase-like amidohydrolase